ncbi:hypothetical protein MUB35_25960 [Blautia sp. NSJ-175]|uniref:hypothetical protein n=1 Tax=Blautia sp. NSJ-175 TaxID=2931396 RepID=UPI001FD176FB|nr:hypothetical protein [Blautia sp. NSJ-175]MCJ7848770.1 hypothetical protein [Blautia sp. NSJ-175]DAH02985.1 MAG TPA: hypothetical protein [Caudoviricetes sp.]
MLTNDDKTILYELYTEYRHRRSAGMSREKSCDFKSCESIHDNFFPDIPIDDVDFSLRALSRNGYVKCFYGSNEILECHLTNNAVAYMESLPKETFLTVIEFVSKFIPW